ncbi:hypothetical protein WJX74_005374 [Apatococcus lobatus]|uniref:Squalene monooxygenase n=2 Tax=Apatococcus TaxID=904362 RepID=A0AAW1SIN1_9CHLO
MSADQHTCVVIGGSIAGTFFAAAAAPVFDRVIVLDRDHLETELTALQRPSHDYQYLCEEAASHKSVFQSLQMHVLLAGGAVSVAKLLPGFKEQCIRSGANHMGSGCPIGTNVKMNYGDGPLPSMAAPDGYSVLLGTRVLFERCARACLIEQHPNVEVRTPCKVDCVIFDAQERSVKGVQLASGEKIPAALVIDATGGRSHVIAQFMKEKCSQTVETVKYDVGLNYHTRFFRIPDKVLQQPKEERTWFSAYMPRPTSPSTVTGMLQVVEGNMYQALISRMNGQKCGPKLEDFMTQLKSLPDQDVYETLKDAEPLGPAFDYLGAKGTQRHFYERLYMPDNYVVLGDALAHLNPCFGSGMTSAAFQADMLREQLTLAANSRQKHLMGQSLSSSQLKGYSNKIQRQAAKAVELPFTLVRDGDLQYDFCKGPRNRSPVQKVVGAYIDGVQDLLPHSKVVAATWLMVAVFLQPPEQLFKPGILREVLPHLAALKWRSMCITLRLCLMAIGLVFPLLVFSAVIRAF